MRKLLIVPSAKLVVPELQAEFGAIPSALIPVGGSPAIRYIYEYYQPLGYRVVVAVCENADAIEQYCDHHKNDLSIDIINVGETASLGETVLKVLQQVGAAEEFAVNLGDTVISGSWLGGNSLYYAKTKDGYRWTTFELDDERRFLSIHEKNENKALRTACYNSFIGVFSFEDAKAFKVHLEHECRACDSGEPFFSAILQYYNALPMSQKQFQESDQWHDFGHIDTYYESRRELTQRCRSFNSMELDARRGTIQKTSVNAEKLVKEILWYLRLPSRLCHIAPRVLAYDLAYTAPAVTLEYYGYPSLDDLYLFGDMDLGAWTRIFDSLRGVLEEMQAYRFDADNSVLEDAMFDMYITKTRERVLSYMANDAFKIFLRANVCINGKECIALDRALDLLPHLAEKSDLFVGRDCTIIHGDMGFGNILYDRRTGIVRLVDPRGEFGGLGIYGDPRYDLAKLSHSVNGDYDFIVNGLFDLSIDKQCIRLEPHLDKRHQRLKNFFSQWLPTVCNQTQTINVRLIESLLFLSMVPLHKDKPRSQLAYVARGLEVLSDVARKVGVYS